MKERERSCLFFGIYPFFSLMGIGVLLINATIRISYAMICAAALLWVYAFTLTIEKLGAPFLPVKGKKIVLLFVSALASQVFTVFLWMFNPVLALESAFFVFFVPLCFTGSGLCDGTQSLDLADSLSRALTEALVPGILVLGLALIREPLSYGSVSLPGLDIVHFVKEEPLRFVQTSAGALIILGYAAAVYRRFRKKHTEAL